jgi:hypothetical protein
MKARMLLLATVLFCLCVDVSGQAQNKRQLTMTLLPTRESNRTSDNFLWIQNNPAKDVYMQFDLSSLPPGLAKADFVRCTLRIVAQQVTYAPDDKNSGGQLVIVKGQIANNDFTSVAQGPDIVSLSTLLNTPRKKTNDVALAATDALADAVYQKYTGDKIISFKLHSDSHKASSLFYSSTNPASPSNIPRLVIEYTLPPADLLETASWSQHQQNPEHTGRNPWIPFRAPNGFTLVSVPLPRASGAAAVVDYPLIYRGNLYLISHVGRNNYLFSLDFKGAERWRRTIADGIVQRSPVISREGILYVVTEDQIAGYDLTKPEKEDKSSSGGNLPVRNRYSLGSAKLSADTALTQGNDGSLFLAMAENDQNYIYGFTPSLAPFLKAGPFGSGQNRISTVTVSPDGRKIFAEIRKAAVVINIANPSEQRMTTLARDGDEYYQVPVAGPAGDIMIFADFKSTANKGNIAAYTQTQKIWNASGTLVPQPVLGANRRVYYIQDGVLHGHPYDQRGSADINSSDTGLNATSNLVADGANIIYFWNNGFLLFNPEGKQSVKIDFTQNAGRPADTKPSGGPEQFIRLMLGPDGTLWANNKDGTELYAFKPTYQNADLTLTQTDIRTQTVYRATGTLTIGGDVTISNGTQLLFQAQNGISFGKGFKVEKGASILVRTGF